MSGLSGLSLIRQEPHASLGDLPWWHKAWIALFTLANPWMVLLDKAGLARRPSYRTRDGIRFVARGDTTDINEAVIVLSGREYPLALLGLSGTQRPVILDCGGHIGTFSLWVHRHYPEAQLFIMEPVENNLELLRANLALNRITQATVIPYALYSQSGRLYVDLDDKSLDAGQVTTVGPVSGQKYFTIQALTFLQVIVQNQISHIDLMKLDIEGSEYPVLEHSLADIACHVHRIVMEFHPGGDRERRNFIVRTLTERGPYQLIYETKNILGFAQIN